jgi:hypothetical protein
MMFGREDARCHDEATDGREETDDRVCGRRRGALTFGALLR